MGERGAEDGRLSPSLSFCGVIGQQADRAACGGMAREAARERCDDGTRLRTAVVFWKLRGRRVDARHRHENSGAFFARPLNAERCVPCHVASCSSARMRAFFLVWRSSLSSLVSSCFFHFLPLLFSSPLLVAVPHDCCDAPSATGRPRRPPPPARTSTDESRQCDGEPDASSRARAATARAMRTQLALRVAVME